MSTKRYVNPLAEGRLRNKICPCGSGLKAKKCHGQDQFVSMEKREEITTVLRNFQDLIQAAIKVETNESSGAEENIQ